MGDRYLIAECLRCGLYHPSISSALASLEDSEFGLAFGEAMSVYQLDSSGKEAFTQGIVKTIANRSNRWPSLHSVDQKHRMYIETLDLNDG